MPLVSGDSIDRRWRKPNSLQLGHNLAVVSAIEWNKTSRTCTYVILWRRALPILPCGVIWLFVLISKWFPSCPKFKARLSAKLLIWKNRAHNHKKVFALSLVLKVKEIAYWDSSRRRMCKRRRSWVHSPSRLNFQQVTHDFQAPESNWSSSGLNCRYHFKF